MDGFESLKFDDKAEIPPLGDHDVLVNFHYASLNYRDLIIPKVSELEHITFSELRRPQAYFIRRANTPFP